MQHCYNLQADATACWVCTLTVGLQIHVKKYLNEHTYTCGSMWIQCVCSLPACRYVHACMTAASAPVTFRYMAGPRVGVPGYSRV